MSVTDVDLARADLLQVMIDGIRVDARGQIKPTFRVPAVRIESGYIEPTEVNANHCASLPGGPMSLDDAE